MKRTYINTLILILILICIQACNSRPKKNVLKEKHPPGPVELELVSVSVEEQQLIQAAEIQQEITVPENPPPSQLKEPQACGELGLFEEEKCSLCEEIPEASCVLSITLSNGTHCYECGQKQKSCRSLGLLEKAECTFCNEIPNTECVVNQNKNCYQCVQQQEDRADLGLINEEKPQKIVIQIAKEIPRDIGESQNFQEPQVPEQQEPLEKPIDNQEKCGDYGFFDKEECDSSCPQCGEAQILSDGTACYRCQVTSGDPKCLKNGHKQDCSDCSIDQRCEENNLIVFYDDHEKSPVMTCYHCVDK